MILYEPAFAVITRVYGPRYKQAILLMTFAGRLGQHFRHSLRAAPDRAHRLAADARVMPPSILGVAFLIHWLFVPGPA